MERGIGLLGDFLVLEGRGLCAGLRRGERRCRRSSSLVERLVYKSQSILYINDLGGLTLTCRVFVAV